MKKTTLRKNKDFLKFPVRLPLPKRGKKYTFSVNLGSRLKFRLRNLAKTRFPHIYFKQIIFPQNPDLSERLDMTVGRWVFGIPSYKGHIIAYEDNAWVPKGTPAIVEQLMEKLQEKLK